MISTCWAWIEKFSWVYQLLSGFSEEAVRKSHTWSNVSIPFSPCSGSSGRSFTNWVPFTPSPESHHVNQPPEEEADMITNSHGCFIRWASRLWSSDLLFSPTRHHLARMMRITRAAPSRLGVIDDLPPPLHLLRSRWSPAARWFMRSCEFSPHTAP